jgi:hypothetical protein
MASTDNVEKDRSPSGVFKALTGAGLSGVTSQR